MATRIRLLIYKGSKTWIDKTQEHEAVKGTRTYAPDMQIASIELNPLRITILELLRVFFKREGSR